jgi:DNA-binding NarL/FixJ family response regulator
MSFPPTFLIVDDSERDRFLTRSALETEFPGCKTVECACARDALARVSDVVPDAVLTDYKVGSENGADLIEKLRAGGVDGPGIVLTGSVDPAIRQHALKAGAAGVFQNWEEEYLRFLREALFSRGWVHRGCFKLGRDLLKFVR